MQYADYIEKMTRQYYMTLFGSIVMPVIFVIACIIFSKVKVQGIVTTQNYEKMNFIIHLVLNTILIGASIIMFFSSFSIYRDLSNVVKKQYVQSIGIVIGQDIATEYPETRGVVLKDITNGRKFSFTAYYGPMHFNDKYKVIYWPYSGIGAVIEKLE